LGMVRVKTDPKQPALVALTGHLTAAGIAWRRDRTDEIDDLSGPTTSIHGLGLQLVVGGHGWMMARLELTGGRVESWMSSMRDSWADLLDTLTHSATTGEPAYCALLEEPACKLVVIVPIDGGKVRVEIRHLDDDFYGNETDPSDGSLLGTWTGLMRDLVTVVAGASRGVIETAGLDGIEDGWGLNAPLDPLDNLEEWLNLTDNPAAT
jgi:hypothetical protein